MSNPGVEAQVAAAKAYETLFVPALFGQWAPRVVDFPSIRAMVEADLRGWLPVMGVDLTEEQIARILEDAEDELAPYVTDDGRVAFDVPAHVVTARKH